MQPYLRRQTTASLTYGGELSSWPKCKDKEEQRARLSRRITRVSLPCTEQLGEMHTFPVADSCSAQKVPGLATHSIAPMLCPRSVFPSMANTSIT